MIFTGLLKQHSGRTGPVTFLFRTIKTTKTTTILDKNQTKQLNQSLSSLVGPSEKSKLKIQRIRKPKTPLSCYDLYSKDLSKKSKEGLTSKIITELWNNETKQVIEKYNKLQNQLQHQYSFDLINWNNHNKQKVTKTDASLNSSLNSNLIKKKQLSCYNIYIKEKLKQARETYVLNGSNGIYPTLEEIRFKWRNETDQVKQLYRTKARAKIRNNDEKEYDKKDQKQNNFNLINPKALTAYSIYKQENKSKTKVWKNESLEIKQKYKILAIDSIINYEKQIIEWNLKNPNDFPYELPILLKHRLNKLNKSIKPTKLLPFDLYKENYIKKDKNKNYSLKQVKKLWGNSNSKIKSKYQDLADAEYFRKVEHWNKSNPKQLIKLSGRIENKETKKIKLQKPVNSYVLYMMDFKKKNPNVKMKVKEIAVKWRNESMDIKTKYSIMSSKLYEKYKQELEINGKENVSKVKKLSGYNIYVLEKQQEKEFISIKEISKNWKLEHERVKQKYKDLALVKYFKDVDHWNNIHLKDGHGIKLSEYMNKLKKKIQINEINGSIECGEVIETGLTGSVIGSNENMPTRTITTISKVKPFDNNFTNSINTGLYEKISSETEIAVQTNDILTTILNNVNYKDEIELSGVISNEKNKYRSDKLMNSFILPQNLMDSKLITNKIENASVRVIEYNIFEADDKTNYSDKLLNTVQKKEVKLQNKNNNEFEIIDYEKAIKQFAIVVKKGKRRRNISNVIFKKQKQSYEYDYEI